MQSSGSSSVVSCNTVVCYFGGSDDSNKDQIASALKDKKQTSFLLSFLKPLSPNNIECQPNWLVITCNKQIYDHQIQYINETFQDTIKDSPQYKPLTHVTIMLQITFELCKLKESINGMRERLKHREIHSSDMDNFLYTLSLQLENVHKNQKIPNNVVVQPLLSSDFAMNSNTATPTTQSETPTQTVIQTQSQAQTQPNLSQVKSLPVGRNANTNIVSHELGLAGGGQQFGVSKYNSNNSNELKQNETNYYNSNFNSNSQSNGNGISNSNHQRSLSTHIRSLNINDIDMNSATNGNNYLNSVQHTQNGSILSFSDALLYDLHKRKKLIQKLTANEEKNSEFKSYMLISKSSATTTIYAMNSGSKGPELPQPKETVVYPMQLYLPDNDIPYFEDTIMSSNYNGTTFMNNNKFYYNNSNNNTNNNNNKKGDKPKMAGISQIDFIDRRRFHLKTEIVADWVRNRLYLMRGNDLSARRIEEYMVKYNYKRIFDIIDVRCHDFVGGNIPNAYNCSFEEFDECMPQLLLTFQNHSDLIFHCMYSQHRGPRAAYDYWAKRREWETMYPTKLHKQRVWILEGGFKKWLGEYILDSDLVSNYQSKYWEEEFFPLTGREFFYNNDWKPHDNKE